MAPVAPPSATMTHLTEHGYEPFDSIPIHNTPHFKSHKPLPRPHVDSSYDSQRRLRTPENKETGLSLETTSSLQSNSQSSSPRTLKHKTQRLGSRPDLPPTPPSQSRVSSGSQSTIQANPTISENGRQPSQTKSRRPPTTPPDHNTPPTPDVTPPQLVTAPKPLRPYPGDRSVAGTTPSASRTESFTTAREEQVSSEDDSAKTNVKQYLDSGRTSQTTVLRVPEAVDDRSIPPQVLDVALGRLNQGPSDPYTPRTTKEFDQFDGQWPPGSDWKRDQRREEDQDTRRSQVVTSRRKRQEHRPERTPVHPTSHGEVLEDNIIAPTAATRAARSMHPRDTIVVDSSPVSSSRPSISETSASVDARRSSGTSAHSSISPVVEVILVDGPPARRQRTLRHVKKQHALRDLIGVTVPNRSVSDLDPLPKRLPHHGQREDRRSQWESQRSHSTTRPISSGKARRDIWSSGAIPVVVVPDRRSSQQSSKEPSLRSTSSRRSRRSRSVGSSGEDVSRREPPISNARQTHHSRRASESTPRDERTIDFPPVIPPRSSSLSAPTSRNGSRAASMTADSIHSRRAFEVKPEPTVETPAESQIPLLVQEDLASPNSDIRRPSNAQSSMLGDDGHGNLTVDYFDDNNSTRKFSSRNTPFSAASIDTSGTAPEVSEALAVQMFPHQNSSLLMVNHSNKPSDASDATTEKADELPLLPPPRIVATEPGGQPPVTPPDQQGNPEEVDSPLRNPRAPPQPPSHPPAINLIPATPSGGTPAQDRGRPQQQQQLGSYFDTGADRPARRPSLIRRAFSRRRHSIDYPPTASKPPGFLKRTFSLTRSVGRPSLDEPMSGINRDLEWTPAYPTSETEPVEQHKLHPFWRPEGDYEVCEYGAECPHHGPRRAEPRHGPNSRPPIVKRSLSNRMKQTFSILPTRPEERYRSQDLTEPERRTIRRTHSGNLRVMRRRSSAESLNRLKSLYGPQPIPSQVNSRLPSVSDARASEPAPRRGRRFSIGAKLDELQNFPRKLSERKREKRSEELRRMISAPTEVRDGLGEVTRYPQSNRLAY